VSSFGSVSFLAWTFNYLFDRNVGDYALAHNIFKEFLAIPATSGWRESSPVGATSL